MLNSTKLYDLSNSYLTWLTKSDSYGRWDINSICFIYDKKDSLIDELVGVGPVMAADVYGNSPLFHKPEYSYQAIFGKKDVLILRNDFPFSEGDSFHKIKTQFKELCKSYKLINQETIVEIKRENINNSIKNNKLLLEIKIGFGDKKYVIICTPKHINFHKIKNKFQIETGPVVVPEFSNRIKTDFTINSTFSYIAINSFDNLDLLKSRLNPNEKLKYYNDHYNMKADIKLYKY